MERVFDDGATEVWSTHLVPGVEFTSPRPKRDFAALIVVFDPSVARDSQAAISERIVRDGCRYAVCTGHACSTWDTSVDAAYLAQDANWSPPEDRFVMTTSHQDESLEEAIEHFHMRTAFNHFVPTLFLAIIIGGSTAEYQSVRARLRTRWSAA